MDLSFGCEAACSDGPCGRFGSVIVNPVTEDVTHVVIETASFPHEAVLVPLSYVEEATAERLLLSCSKAELHQMDPFLDVEFVSAELYNGLYDAGGLFGDDPFYLWPYAVPRWEDIPVEVERVPPGELAINRGTAVQAADGHVGKVDEFVVHPHDGHITHFVLRHGHLWGKKEVTIPVSAIDHLDEDGVHLSLDKEAVEALPSVPVHRKKP